MILFSAARTLKQAPQDPLILPFIIVLHVDVLSMKKAIYSSDSIEGSNTDSTMATSSIVDDVAETRSPCKDSQDVTKDLANGISRLPGSPPHNTAIAVVGMASRLSGDATSPAALWEMLMNNKSSRTEVPKDRYNADALYREDSALPNSVRHSY